MCLVRSRKRISNDDQVLIGSVLAVAKALGTTIYCDPRKKSILLCQADPELHSLLSTDPYAVCLQFRTPSSLKLTH